MGYAGPKIDPKIPFLLFLGLEGGSGSEKAQIAANPDI